MNIFTTAFVERVKNVPPMEVTRRNLIDLMIELRNIRQHYHATWRKGVATCSPIVTPMR